MKKQLVSPLLSRKYSGLIKICICIIPFLLTTCSISKQGYFYALVPNYVKKQFKYCYDGKSTGIENLMNVDGYYNTGRGYLMFYRDGTFVDNFFDFNKWNIHDYFKRLKTIKNEKTLFENSADWGRYVLSNDTLKVFLINHPSPMADTWMAYNESFKIINKRTLLRINIEPFDEHVYIRPDSNKDKPKYGGVFEYAPDRPDSANWLKREKWFWCK